MKGKTPWYIRPVGDIFSAPDKDPQMEFQKPVSQPYMAIAIMIASSSAPQQRNSPIYTLLNTGNRSAQCVWNLKKKYFFLFMQQDFTQTMHGN